MGHAWLDSLSEDWVSEPGSDAPSPAAPSPDTNLPPKPTTPSRIPRLTPGIKRFQNAVEGSTGNGSTTGNSKSSPVLGERSINERLAALSRRTPSKLSNELSTSPSAGRDCHACRNPSTSTTSSVVKRTIHRKSLSFSMSKGRAGPETPEWKRRLIYGDLSYGERPDLFTSAGTGLENMFKPPQPTPGPSRASRTEAEVDAAVDADAEYEYQEQQPALDMTLPSSPPLYRRDPSTVEIHVDESTPELPQARPKRAATAMRYRRTDESADASKNSDLSPQQHDGRSHQASTTDQTALSDGAGGDSRKVSGRSDIRNEDFSPIPLERRQASNGTTTFAPAEMVPPDELRTRLETLQRTQSLHPDDAYDTGSVQIHGTSRTVESTSQDYRRLGGFVNFRRGGRSEEGSFRNHMLSSALNDSSELNPEESLQASTPKQFPTVRVERWDSSEHAAVAADSPDLPRAPEPSPDKRLAPVRPSNGSPLKLFQPYDTFTNQTLLRRLSQMYGEPADYSFSIAVDSSRLPAGSPHRLLPPVPRGGSEEPPFGYANRFGAGELDGYEFNDEFSHMSHDATGVDGDKENREPDEESMLPPHPPIFDLTHTSSPSEAAEIVVNRRRKSTTSHPSRRSTRTSFPANFEVLSPPGGRRDLSGPEIKRPRTSPSKDPTPKRRRTLHKSDISYGTEEATSGVDSVHMPRQHMPSGLGRFRQDAHNSSQEDEDEDEFDARQSVRPRTPTPSQRSSVFRERQPLAEIERSPARSSRHSQPSASLPMGETRRKPSIKTEDFINEANKIMAMIRNKAGLPSGLASLEESDEDKGQLSPDLDGSFEESTQEPFSRPPSREGRPPLTRLSTKQEDPVLAEQLKKYEEASDMGDILPSSVRSARLSQDALSAAAREQEESVAWGDDEEVVSDPPNMRISRDPNWQEHQANGFSDDIPSRGSAGFNTQSSAGLSVQTGSSFRSSRSSDVRKTIMPESVQHLIPDQVGNMVLDKQRNIWVKRKSSAESRGSWLQSEASEDDPFADIPDLTVDVTKEMQNLLLTGKKEAEPQGRVPSAAQLNPPKQPRVPSLARSPAVESDGSPIARFPSHARRDESVEREIKIGEGRAKEPRRLTITFSSPVASVIQDAAGLNDVLSEDSALSQAAEARDLPAWGRRVVSVRTTAKGKSTGSGIISRGPQRHLSVRGRAMVARPVSRIDERDEDSVPEQEQRQDAGTGMELSVLGDYSLANREDMGPPASLSVLVTTPTRVRTCPVPGVDATPIISQYVGTFSLSPLSEFTMHRAEETLPLEASYVVGNHHLVTGDPSRRVMSQSLQELVDKLAEVEPFEPYWEDMRELELRKKGLSSLHALDEYCGQLESLDVSRNKIRNLGGIPASVLHLRMTHNQLSGLTAWHHLANLHHVDVSNNALTSLAVFKSLVHLRSLRADNNQITSLDGIKFHKTLQTLRARGNLISSLDFDASTLHQLTDLDLKANKIVHVANLSALPCLTTLNLDANLLTTFASHSPLPLRYLHLADNNLASLSVHHLPHIRLLHADRNRLARISGLARAKRLDSLSLREQRGDVPFDVAHLLVRACEVRKLYLSGNFLQGGFEPGVDLLNLQLLEVANCGLEGLHEEVGLAMPNLRVLNVNMNALSDLSGVRGVQRLKRLLVVGNRLADPAKVVGVLEGLRSLAVVDLRDNPLCVGFYAPGGGRLVVKKSSSREEEEDRGEQFVLGEQDAERDARYCARLDMDTRVRRRVYEALVRKRCGRVRTLDGLPLGGVSSKGKGLLVAGEEGEEKEDVVLRAMREKGLVKVEEGEKVEGEKTPGVGERSGRWPAEDSFA
ncbi:hypothetical protein C8A05DRAFT_11780 [Staphylotrichum tortipilum]|uniref:Septation initiation network scaffold protein cdc11 n=1 Tax=Staphylotrichum tortipilum TaxID=2831512 RepID=A0AAN6MUE8_9PEZI|nr:hypothetical protein C8A05DRAFT_11780 [Staphylotrichum longicolle]